MAFLVQDDLGTIVGANAYSTVAEFKDYHATRGNSILRFLTDEAIETAIVRATDYIDRRFGSRYSGCQKSLEQSTAFPRLNSRHSAGFSISDTIPLALKQAVSEYALRTPTASTSLAPDLSVDASGGRVIRKLEKVAGAVTEETEYAEGVAPSKFRPYPLADTLLSVLFKVSSNSVIR